MRLVRSGVLAVLLMGSATALAGDSPAGGGIIRVSVSSAGEQANSRSSTASQTSAISGDGSAVAFDSSASNLVAHDTNGMADVFVREPGADATTRVSLSGSGIQGNRDSLPPSGLFINEDRGGDPAISADGRYVAFISQASNLVALDTNHTEDIFVRDRDGGTIDRVSVDSAGSQANEGSYRPAISSDGRYVAFNSAASNLVAGDTNQAMDTFVHDLQTGATVRVSIGNGGGQANGPSFGANAVSGDGRYVAFSSAASNLVTGDTNQNADVFLRDLQAGTTTRVSVGSAEEEGDGGSAWPSISSDGRFVAFHSDATNLVAGDSNGSTDVFVRDLQSGTTSLVSVGAGAVQAAGQIGRAHV